MPLTHVETIPGSFGGLSVHANFVWDDYEMHVMENGVIRSFQVQSISNRRVFGRRAQLDVTLSAHPAGTVWGFTESRAGDWFTLTRETSTGVIGRIRHYDHDGGFLLQEWAVPAVVAGLNTPGTAMRAPKGLADIHGELFVRVVRGDTGNMRFLKFSEIGDPLGSLTLESSSPSSLRDIAGEGDTYLYVLSRSGTSVTVTAINPDTGVEVPGEGLTRTIAGADGIYVHNDRLYIASQSTVDVFEGVPVYRRGGGSGFPFGAFVTGSMMVQNEWMGRDIRNRRNRR